VPHDGKYAVWLRARWEPGAGTGMELRLDDGLPRDPFSPW
jgi:hypothetical protein